MADRRKVVGNRFDRTGGIHGIGSGYRTQSQRTLLDRLGERPYLIQRGPERHYPVAGDPSVGGLERHHACERTRLADGTARVGAQRHDDLAGTHCSGTPSAGSAGDPLEVPGVVSGPVRRVLRGRTERELVHVALAHQDGTRIEQAPGGGAVVDAHMVAQDLRTGRRVRADYVHVVLQTHRHTGQRRQQVVWVCARRACSSNLRVDPVGCLESNLRGRLQERMDVTVDGLHACERRLGDLASRKSAGCDAFTDMSGGQSRKVDAAGGSLGSAAAAGHGIAHCSSPPGPTIRGITNAPSSTSGAFFNASA